MKESPVGLVFVPGLCRLGSVLESEQEEEQEEGGIPAISSFNVGRVTSNRRPARQVIGGRLGSSLVTGIVSGGSSYVLSGSLWVPHIELGLG